MIDIEMAFALYATGLFIAMACSNNPSNKRTYCYAFIACITAMAPVAVAGILVGL